jgi:hypothetical protein
MDDIVVTCVQCKTAKLSRNSNDLHYVGSNMHEQLEDAGWTRPCPMTRTALCPTCTQKEEAQKPIEESAHG